MRLIDADVLTEILSTAIRYMKGVAKFIGAEDDPELKMEIKAYADILNGVKEQPTIEPEQKWIPCSEGLPKKSGRYFISVRDGIQTRTTVAPYQPRCKAWTMTGRMAYWKVIAWMPLPEPYKEGER